jgi:hypothetical protein
MPVHESAIYVDIFSITYHIRWAWNYDPVKHQCDLRDGSYEYATP